MGHTRRRNGKVEYSSTCFLDETNTAMNSVKPDDLKPGDKVAMSGKSQTYMGSTDHAGDGSTETHHFQDSKGGYNSYPTNSVPPMQSRDAMEKDSD